MVLILVPRSAWSRMERAGYCYSSDQDRFYVPRDVYVPLTMLRVSLRGSCLEPKRLHIIFH